MSRTDEEHHNGRLAQCIVHHTWAEGAINELRTEVNCMKKANQIQDASIESLRLTLARWGGVIAVLTIIVGIIGPVIARQLFR